MPKTHTSIWRKPRQANVEMADAFIVESSIDATPADIPSNDQQASFGSSGPRDANVDKNRSARRLGMKR
jgi:hypothetical protein